MLGIVAQCVQHENEIFHGLSHEYPVKNVVFSLIFALCALTFEPYYR